MNCCAIIPVYNHEEKLSEVIESVLAQNLPVIIVDDGSNESCKRAIKMLVIQYKNVRSYRLPTNQGKGAAVVRAILEAKRLGFTHALQIDADGQHDKEAIPLLLKQAEKFPNDLITGVPEYDESQPLQRKLGRYLTHIWVWINTLSFQIQDSLMGFRVYPVNPFVDLVNKQKIGRRMEFDPEIMVRLFWEGVNVKSIPVKVIYPEDGVSHFNLLRDNALISKMHATLFFGMLLRFPRLLFRRKTRKYG